VALRAESLFKNDTFALVDLDSLPTLAFGERRQQTRRLRIY
jgi:hypothetical protein